MPLLFGWSLLKIYGANRGGGEMQQGVGDITSLYGTITKLYSIGSQQPRRIEEMLGFHSGRLARGYWICLLLGRLKADDFEFEGTTLRSGGKLGLPRSGVEADGRRSFVRAQMKYEHGEDEYQRMKTDAADEIPLIGRDRLAKVVPVLGHMKHGSPAKQYPMGGGALQWKIIKERPQDFLIAAYVNAQGVAFTPDFQARVDAAAGVPDRTRLVQYLQTAMPTAKSRRHARLAVR